MFSLLLPLLLVTGVLCNPPNPAPHRRYIIHNRCPTSINLWIDSSVSDRIQVDGSVEKIIPADQDITFNTDANLGGPIWQHTTAFFHGNQYCLVKGKGYFNVGMQITPHSESPVNGFCGDPRCDNAACTTAFSDPPATWPGFGTSGPAPPYYECWATSYDVIFCPGWMWPQA